MAKIGRSNMLLFMVFQGQVRYAEWAELVRFWCSFGMVKQSKMKNE
jgi:hypothetical protein